MQSKTFGNYGRGTPLNKKRKDIPTNNKEWISFLQTEEQAWVSQVNTLYKEIEKLKEVVASKDFALREQKRKYEKAIKNIKEFYNAKRI